MRFSTSSCLYQLRNLVKHKLLGTCESPNYDEECRPFLVALFNLQNSEPEHRLRLYFQWDKKEMPTHSTTAVFHHPSECRLLGVKLPPGLFEKPLRVLCEQVPLHHQLCGLCLPSGF